MSAEGNKTRNEGPESGSGAARVVHPMEWAKHSGAMPDVLLEMESVIGARRQRRMRAVTAAMCALLIAAVGWRIIGRHDASPANAAPTLLVHGAPAEETLPDGSKVELREGGKIALQFSEGMRRVTLQHGEAFFHVAKNPARPFVVQVNGIDVRAVGTAFAVQKSEKCVQVIVTEGQVAVEKSPVIAAQPDKMVGPAEDRMLATLKVGGQAVVDVAEAGPSAQVSQLSHAEVASRLSWRVPVLEFTGTTLAEVVDLVNRHIETPLVLEERSLRDLKLSGMLQADNVDTLLKLLEEDHGIRAVPRGSGEIGLSRKK